MTANLWNLARVLVQSLRRFEDLTRKASRSDALSSMVIPSISMLQLALGKHTDDRRIQTITTSMLESVDRRFNDIESRKLLVLSTFPDPWYKTVFFADETTQQKTKDWLSEESTSVPSSKSESSNEPIQGIHDAQPQGQSDPFDDEFAQFLEEKGALTSKDSQGHDIRQEIGLFMADPL